MVRFSLGNFQFRAVGVNMRLPFRMAEGVADLFLEQCWEEQQWVERHPRERGGLVGSAPDGGIQFGLCRGQQRFGEQAVLKPLKLIFLGGAEWSRRRGPQFEARLRAEFGP